MTQCGRLLRRRGKSSRSCWKGPICWYVADVTYSGMTIFAVSPDSRARAPSCCTPLSHLPAAARYTKLTTRASSGKSRRANVVLPTPSGPAITMDRGCPLSFAILQQHTCTSVNPGEGLSTDILLRSFSAQIWSQGRTAGEIGASKSSFAATLRHAAMRSATSRSSTLRSPSYSPRLRTE